MHRNGLPFLDDAAVREIFGGGAIPIIAGHGGPNGTVVVERDGFRLSGHWRYGSGIKHAAYIHSGAIVVENGAPRRTADGEPEIRIFVTPRDRAVLKGNWDVLGLRATGSVDYAISDLFVPESFSHTPAVLEPRRGGNVYRIGLLALPSLGIPASRSASAGVPSTRSPHSPATSPARPDGCAIATPSASSTARLRRISAPRVRSSMRPGPRSSARSSVVIRCPRAKTTLARLAISHATSIAADVCGFAYRADGGLALRDGPLQRCFRDIHAGTQHLHAHPLILRECGRKLAGLAEGQV